MKSFNLTCNKKCSGGDFWSGSAPHPLATKPITLTVFPSWLLKGLLKFQALHSHTMSCSRMERGAGAMAQR